LQKGINSAILSLAMKKLILQKRELLGKKVKSLRREGLIPAVVYNSKTESFNTVLKKNDAQWLYKNTTSATILDGEFEGRVFKFLIKEFNLNSVTGEINHVSIFEIDENAPMVFKIPFNLVGVSPAVKNNLGILVNALDSIDVRCQLSKLVSEIEIDISSLTEPGQTITVEDITLPEGMTLINDDIRTTAIVTIADAQKVEDAMIADKEATAVDAEGEEAGEVGEETTEEGSEETTK